MNITEHLLTCLAEESAEIVQDCAKALRFGLDDKNVLEPDGPSNRERIINELNDFVAVVGLLIDRDVIPANWSNHAAQAKKKTKVSKFMDYAARKGALSEHLKGSHE